MVKEYDWITFLAYTACWAWLFKQMLREQFYFFVFYVNCALGDYAKGLCVVYLSSLVFPFDSTTNRWRGCLTNTVRWYESVVGVNRLHHGLTLTAGPHDDTPEPPKDVSDAHSLTMTNASGLNGWKHWLHCTRTSVTCIGSQKSTQVEYWGKARHGSRRSFQRMILPRSSMIQSRPSAPPRLQRRRMMSRTSRRQQSTSGLR